MVQTPQTSINNIFQDFWFSDSNLSFPMLEKIRQSFQAVLLYLKNIWLLGLEIKKNHKQINTLLKTTTLQHFC